MISYIIGTAVLAAIVFVIALKRRTEVVEDLEGWDANPSQDLRNPLSNTFTRF